MNWVKLTICYVFTNIVNISKLHLQGRYAPETQYYTKKPRGTPLVSPPAHPNLVPVPPPTPHPQHSPLHARAAKQTHSRTASALAFTQRTFAVHTYTYIFKSLYTQSEKMN